MSENAVGQYAACWLPGASMLIGPIIGLMSYCGPGMAGRVHMMTATALAVRRRCAGARKSSIKERLQLKLQPMKEATDGEARTDIQPREGDQEHYQVSRGA